MKCIRFTGLARFAIGSAISLIVLSHGASAAEVNGWKPIDDKLICTSSTQAIGGYAPSTISVADVIYEAESENRFIRPSFLSALSGGGKSQTSASTIGGLMRAYYHFNPSPFAGMPKEPETLQLAMDASAASLDSDQRAALQKLIDSNNAENKNAAEVYGAIRNYLIHVVFDQSNKTRFAIDPNGAPMGRFDWKNLSWNTPLDSADDKADWLLWQLAAGENFQIGCNDGRNTVADAAGAESGPVPASGAKNDGPLDLIAKTGSYHVGGERDDLALSSYLLTDPLVTSPSFSVQPGNNKSKSSNTYNFSAQGAAGFTFWQHNCTYEDFPVHDCTPQSAMLFADAFYGQDKNAPKSMGSSSQTIDRIGGGLDYSLRWDPSFLNFVSGDGVQNDNQSYRYLHRVGFLLQFIPEFVTDTQFESKTFYGEVRADVIDLPYFTCFGASTTAEPLWGLQLSCGAAAIADYESNYRQGPQTLPHDDFERLGGEIGLGIAPDAGLCDDSLCSLLTEKLSLSVWYKVLNDVSSNGASVHNLTTQLAYNISGSANSSGGKGLSLTLQYTDGREDITLYKLPTWSVGLKGAM